MTKTISPVSTWYNGASVSGTQLYVNCIYDDLDSQANYFYQIRSSTGLPLAEGNLEMTGSDYTSRTDNDYTWEWAADQLGLTLTE